MARLDFEPTKTRDVARDYLVASPEASDEKTGRTSENLDKGMPVSSFKLSLYWWIALASSLVDCIMVDQ